MSEETVSEKTIAQNTCWLDARAILIRGELAKEFLQGYLTCDTQRIQPGSAVPMAMCTVKGRVVASGWAVQTPNGIGLIVHASLVETVENYLKPYVTFSKCQFAAGQSQYVVRAANADSSGWTLPISSLGEYAWQLTETLSANVTNCSQTIAFKLAEADFVWLQAPSTGEFLPQMLNLHEQNAVDFDKGCYLGQEIVARAQFRGAVKRGLKRWSWQDIPPVLGDQTERGVVVQAASNPSSSNSGISHAVGKVD